MKKHIKIILLNFFMIVVIVILLIINSNHLKKNDIVLRTEKENIENTDSISYDIFANNKNENIQILVTVQSDKKINSVEYPNGEKLFLEGKDKVAIDYQVEKGVTYIFKAILGNGSEISKTIKIDDDELAKSIDIDVTPEREYGTEANMKINFNTIDKLIKKEYRIGNTGTYIQYSDNNEIVLDSYDILDNQYGLNEDNTITIYARAIDYNGYGIEVEKKINCLDFDMPNAPVVTISDVTSEYAILTENGVKVYSSVEIQFDNRDDIENYYSLDKGKTWNKVNGDKLEKT